MNFYLYGKEKALIDCTEKEIDLIMEDYHFQDAVEIIKNLVKQNQEQKQMIEGLKHLLHADILKEVYHDRVE